MTGSSLEHACTFWARNFVFRGPWKIQLSAIVCRESVILLNSCCFFLPIPDNNRSRLEEVPCLDYSLKKFFIFFNHYAKNGLKKDRFASTWPDSNIRIVLGWFWMSWNKGKYSGSWTEKLMVLLSWSTCSTWHSVTTGVPHVPAFLISEKLILTRAGLFKAGLVLIPG